MLVTAIEPRKKSLSAVYIDGEFSMNLDTQTLIENRIHAGVQLDDERLHEIIILSNTRRAKEKALWLISYRDYAKKELIDKVKKYADEETATAAVERLEELGLINDQKYAARLASDLVNIKHLSIKGARYKMFEKGLDRDLVDEVLGEIDNDPCEHIKCIINKKYINTLNSEKGKRRAIAGLQRLGYNYSDINSVLNEYINDNYYD